MDRTAELLRGAVLAVRGWFSTLASQSERTILLGTVLLASAVSAATGFVLNQYYSVRRAFLSRFLPEDCFLDWGTQIGRHCFSDYGWTLGVGMRPNPWEPYRMFLPWYNSRRRGVAAAGGDAAANIVRASRQWLHSPRLGLLAYLLALTIAFLTPAVWAARGARGLERVVVFVAFGVAAIPAWMAIDRGNSVGFVVPIALVFLVALCRRRWGLAAIMVVLAALVKPQFAMLVLRFSRPGNGGWAASRWPGRDLQSRLVSPVAAGLSRNNHAVDPQHARLRPIPRIVPIQRRCL